MHMNNTDTQALGKSLDAARQQLEDDGCMLVARLCDPGFVARLLAISLSRSGKVMAALNNQPIGIGSAAGFDGSCSDRQGAGTFRSHHTSSM